jgi:hypothetical protein
MNKKREELGELICYSNRLQAGWPGFDSRQCKIYLLSTVSRLTGAHPSYNPVGTGGCFPGGGVKRQGRVALADLHLMTRSRKVELYLHPPPICLHGIVLNVLSTGITLFFLPCTKQERYECFYMFYICGVDKMFVH